MPKLSFPGNLRQRGKTWHWSVSLDGERHYATLRGSYSDAVQQAKARYAQLEAAQKRRSIGLPGQMRVSALFDRWEKDILSQKRPGTQHAYRGTLAHFRAYFVKHLNDPWVDHIRPAHVQGYLTQREALGRASATRNGERGRLHMIFDYAELLEVREGNPVRRTDPIKVKTRQPVLLSAVQYESLLAAAALRGPMFHTYVLTLGETGARCDSEVLWLRWEDVDFDSGFLHVRAPKTGDERYVPMTQRLAATMKDHAARFRMQLYGGRRSPWLFHHQRAWGRAAPGQRVGRYDDSFETAVRKANVPAGVHQHDLRHRRITTWLAEGQPLVLVQQAVGHRKLATTQKYLHLVRDDLRALVEPARPRLVQEG